MGHGTWKSNDWDKYTTTHTRGKSTREIFNASSIKKEFDPKNIALRESRDSVDNPHSTPIILALDVTGSMGMIAAHLAREGLGKLVGDILDRKPLPDPQIMVMGVGDAGFDRAPLQATQFEADIRIAEQLKDIYLEGGGGNNQHESYNLPWYFAATKTDIDCVKQGRKGILFTFGDEKCPDTLRADHIRNVLGDSVPKDIPTKELLELVSQKFDVFHVVIDQGNYAQRDRKGVYDSWEKVLPRERIITITDYTKMPEVLVSALEVHAGKDPQAVIDSWQGDAQNVVREGIKHMKQGTKAVTPLIHKIKLKDKNGPKAA